MWEKRWISEIHQRLVAVVSQELFDILRQSDRLVEAARVLHLVVIQLVEQVVGVVAQFAAFVLADPLKSFLIFVSDVITMHGFVADNKTDHVGGVGKFGMRGEIHR